MEVHIAAMTRRSRGRKCDGKLCPDGLFVGGLLYGRGAGAQGSVENLECDIKIKLAAGHSRAHIAKKQTRLL